MPEDPEGEQGTGVYGARYGHNRMSAYEGWGYGYGGYYGYGYPGSSLYRSQYYLGTQGRGYGMYGRPGNLYGGHGYGYGYGYNNFANQNAIQSIGSLEELENQGF